MSEWRIQQSPSSSSSSSLPHERKYLHLTIEVLGRNG
jgi:hypothetical protein